jgi:tetratricopeptide (TPR) repeat protein
VSYIRGYDPETLQRRSIPASARSDCDEIGEQRSLPALLERVWLLKVLGRPEDAPRPVGAVRPGRPHGGHAEDLLRARILHASVVQVRGAFAAAEQELTMCADEAEGQGWSAIGAFAYQHRGRVHYDAGEFDLARRDFKRALFLRQESGAADDQLESTLLAIDAADRRRAAASVAS